MQAVTIEKYGAPNVLELRKADAPRLGANDVLVRVHASPVTYGDRRLRAADYPGMSWLPGRLMTGLFRPKHRIPGTIFAGRIAAVGDAVTRYVEGDDVFGLCLHGAYAEYVRVSEEGAMAKMPAGLDYDDAAATPYGALTALQRRSLGNILGEAMRGCIRRRRRSSSRCVRSSWRMDRGWWR